ELPDRHGGRRGPEGAAGDLRRLRLRVPSLPREEMAVRRDAGALMVPGHVTLLVNYITIGNMGMINTYAGLILPGVASAFGTFLLRQHFMSLPSEVFEAAEVDGAGHLRKLVSFVLPMSVPAVATVALVAVIDEWNNFVWPLIITNSVNMRTLPIGLMYLKSNEGLTNWGVLMSGTLIVVLPML